MVATSWVWPNFNVNIGRDLQNNLTFVTRNASVDTKSPTLASYVREKNETRLCADQHKCLSHLACLNPEPVLFKKIVVS